MPKAVMVLPNQSKAVKSLSAHALELATCNSKAAAMAAAAPGVALMTVMDINSIGSCNGNSYIGRRGIVLIMIAAV